MKSLPLRLTLCALLVFGGATVFAQSANYGRFKGDITAGYSYPTDLESKFGFNFSMEPKFNVTDNIAVGVKVEAAAFLGDSFDGGSSAIIMRSYMATGEYYFGQKKVRPFVGVGVGGIQRMLTSSDEDFDAVITEKMLFGFAPRVGAQFGQFRTAVEFNVAQENTYISVKLGATIGGKRKQ